MSDSFVLLRSYLEPIAAESDRSFLAASGIEARIEGSNLTSALPLHAAAIGGVRLLVRASERDDAERLLASLGDEDEDEEEDEEDAEDEALHRARHEADAEMRRAAAAAFFGLLSCPLVGAAYAMAKLLDVKGPFSPRGQRTRWVAIALVLLEGVRLAAFVGIRNGWLPSGW